MKINEMVEKIQASWEMESHVRVLESQEDAPANWLRIRLSQLPGNIDLGEYIQCMEGMSLLEAGPWVAGITDALLAQENVLAAVRCLRAGIEYVMEHYDVEWEQNEYWQDMAGWMSEMEQGIVFDFEGNLLAASAAFVDPDTGIGAYSYVDMR